MIRKNPPNQDETRKMHRILGRYPGKTLNRIGATIFGIWIVSLSLDIIWPVPDRADNLKIESIETISEFLLSKKKLYILICLNNQGDGLKPEELHRKSETSFILAELRADRLDKFIYFSPMLEIPNSLDGRKNNLDEIYRSGGLALTQDLILEFMNIERESAIRYISIDINDIGEVIKSIGGINIAFKGEVLNINQENLQRIFQIEQTRLSREDDLQIRINLIRDLIKIIYNQIEEEKSEIIINILLDKSTTNMSRSELEQIKEIFREKKGFLLHEKILS